MNNIKITKNDWIKKANNDLKSKLQYSDLIKKNIDDILIEPFYTLEDLKDYDFQKFQTENKSWEIIAEVFHPETSKVQELSEKALQNGSDIIEFCTENNIQSYFGTGINSIKDIKLENINTLSINAGLTTYKCIDDIQELIKRSACNFIITIDPLADRIKYPDLNEKISDQVLRNLVQQERVGIRLNAWNYHYLGANKVQELAYSIYKIYYYIEYFSGKELDLFLESLSIRYSVSIDYFEEIAKLRALRAILSILADENKIPGLKTIKIEAENSTLNFSQYDINNNILRACTSTMSAALAGYDRILTKAFDRHISYNSEFSNRIAINTQQLLKNESYMDIVNDPAAGSFYLESLTQSYMEAALDLIKLLEKPGNYKTLITNSIIQKQIIESKNSYHEQNLRRKRFILGLNQYPNLKDMEKASYYYENGRDIDFDTILNNNEVFSKFEPVKIFEDTRKRTALYKGNKSIFILSFGNVTMRKNRQNFIKNFLSVAGFNFKFNSDENDLSASINEASESESKIIVLCSSDEEYEQILPLLKTDKIIYIAGKNISQLAVKELNLKSNIIESLNTIQRELGIVQ